MPELPEVEAARRAIAENCLGKRIKRAVVADDPKVIDGVTRSDFEAALVGKTLVSALRKGKNLWLQLDSPPFPSFQFGMAGAVYIKGVAVTQYKRSAVKDSDEWPSKYSKLFIELDDGLEMSFTDKRRFARVRLLEDPTSVPPISELGPDALLDPMAVPIFFESLSKKKIAIKAMLLDQSFISGIGNWVADEVLYQAKIHPLQIVSSLSLESCERLLKCIKEVIEKAIEVGADSSQYPNKWIFHSREKKPGKAFVDGKKIDFITAGGRTTAYVPELQKLDGNQSVKAPGSKQKKQTSKAKGVEDDEEDEDVDNDDEPASKGLSNKAKAKRELKPRGRGKQPPTKRKLKASDDEAEDEDEDENDHERDADDIDGDNSSDQEKKPRKVTNGRQAKAKASVKKIDDQNIRKPKKKIK